MRSVNHLPDPCFPLFFGCQEAQSQISGSLHASAPDFSACTLCCPPRGCTWVPALVFLVPGRLFFPKPLLCWMTLDLKTKAGLGQGTLPHCL